MQQPKRKQQEVHIVTHKTTMRFSPLSNVQCSACVSEKSKWHNLMMPSLNFIWSKLRPKPKRAHQSIEGRLSTRQISKSKVEQEERISTQTSIAESQVNNSMAKSHRLTFALRLSADHFLIGNELQLDVIQINCINNRGFVDAEYLWTIKRNNNITHVCIEEKKISMLVVVAQTQVAIYTFDQKKIPNVPLHPTFIIQLEQEPSFVHIVREGNICLFFKEHLQIFLAGQNFRRRYNRKYQLPQIPDSSFELFFVPYNFQNHVSVFFEQKIKKNKNIFALWNMQLEFTPSQIKNHPIQKIYEIKSSLRDSISINNYSKQIFLLNLGSEILALKRGYVLDSATVSIKRQQSQLQYVGNDILLHISHKKIQVYNFSINLNTKPFKIAVKSKDSIKIHGVNENQEFFKSIPILANDYLIIFQNKQRTNLLKNGQLHYSFYVTRALSRDQKLLQLFPKNIRTFKTQDSHFIENCDMAVKMGFTIKQIYLELWSRSYQNSKQDYDLLIATNDYQTISDQIIRKLKKMSVNYTQIEYIQKQCLKMLHFRVFSPKCTFEGVMNYMSCHFFKRKLEMFYEMDFMEKGQKSSDEKSEKLKMTIRQYQFYKNMEIKTQLIQYVNQFCHENKKQVAKNIRFLLKSFKFAFRIIYQIILEQIIKNAKNELLKLLIQIPQILPFEPQQIERPIHIPIGLYHGVWPEISLEQWKNSLFVDAITTIDNKQVILEEVVKSIAFKRNWLSHHDMITLSIENIKKNQEIIRSPKTFYFFIAKLFDHIKNEEVLKGIVNFIEQKYCNQAAFMRKSVRSVFSDNSNIRSSTRSVMRNGSKIVAMPQNIKGKVFLLEKIYRFFQSKNIVPLRNGKSCTLSQFFQFEDPQLIKHCFDKQRSIKGLLLKDIKQIYMACLKNHHQIFNKALLNYFVSDLSQISDLKYLLNRINNQKQQFHRQNRNMYPVLIEALQRKMMIGTGNDIPIDEVLIYLENIPLYTSVQQDVTSLDTRIMGMLGGLIQNPTLSELHAVQRVNKQSNYLRECRINMTIYDILHNPEDVFTRLVEHILENSQDEDWQNMQAFQHFSIGKMSEIEEFASIVYVNQEHNVNYQKTILFIYLAKLCEKLQNIKYANYLLNQDQFLNHYHDFSAEGLVQFMYKWKMVQQNSYIKNQAYINQLLELLPQNSSTRIFIYNELQFAKIFSCSYIQVTFPISDSIINYEDIKHYVHRLCIQEVMMISIDKVYQVVKNIQDIISEEIQYQDEPARQQISMDPQSKVTRYQIYEIFIVKYLKENKVKEVLPLIQTLMTLEKSNSSSNYDIVFAILYILHIVGELNEGNKDNLVQCIWYYFYSPRQLLDKLDYIVNEPLSPHQLKSYIQHTLHEGRNKYLGYNPKNPLFNSLYTSVIETNKNYEKKFMEMLLKVARHIQESKEQFKAIKYHIIVAMLCNDPYALAKFIYCSDEKNVKPIRSILSFAILEDVFEPFSLLEVGRRVFMVLLQTLNRQYPIDIVIKQFNSIELFNDVFIEDYVPPDQDNTFQSIMWKSAEAFRKKKQYLMNDQKTGSKIFKNSINLTQKKNKIIKMFENEQELGQKQLSEYIFSDSDNQQEMEAEIRETGLRKSKGRLQSKFIAKNQRHAIIESTRIKKPCALYKSIQGFGPRKTNRLYVSTSNNASVGSSNLKVSELKNKSSNKIRSQQNIGILTLKMNYSEEYHDDQYPKSAQKLDIDSEGKLQNVARSSPQIDPFIHPNLMEIQSMESAEFDHQPLVTRSQDYQNLMKPIMIQSPRDNQEEIVQASENQKSSIYQIKVNEVQLLSEDQFQNEQSVHMDIQNSAKMDKKQQSSKIQKNVTINRKQQSELQSISMQLINDNKSIQQIYGEEFDLSLIDGITDEDELIQIMKIMYQKCDNRQTLQLILKIMQRIIETRHPKGLHSEIFHQIVKIQQVQQKMLPEVAFRDLLPSSSLLRAYSTSQDLFMDVYTSLRRYIGSENIYTISQFIRRVFDNPQFEQQIIWDFTLDLCQKIQSNTLQEREWNLEKIQGTLPKVEIAIWNKNFDSFKKKVLQPDCRDELLEIFCQAAKNRREVDDAIIFLENVQNVYNSDKVAETLQALLK